MAIIIMPFGHGRGHSRQQYQQQLPPVVQDDSNSSGCQGLAVQLKKEDRGLAVLYCAGLCCAVLCCAVQCCAVP